MQIGAVPLALVEEGRQQALPAVVTAATAHVCAIPVLTRFADFHPEISFHKKV